MRPISLKQSFARLWFALPLLTLACERAEASPSQHGVAMTSSAPVETPYSAGSDASAKSVILNLLEGVSSRKSKVYVQVAASKLVTWEVLSIKSDYVRFKDASEVHHIIPLASIYSASYSLGDPSGAPRHPVNVTLRLVPAF